MAKSRSEIEFPTKEFNLLVPFTKVAPVATDAEGESEESLTIEGFANWYGEDVDESGEGVACDLVGDAVVPSGIDLSVYKGNPQILWQHDRCCSIGKANKTVRKKQGLFVNATIYKSAMEEADWFRVKSGLVTRFSIGFRTIAGEYKEVAGQNIFFITKSLLMEISIVTLPCSPESGFAIIKSLEDGSFMSSDYKETQPDPTEEVLITSEKEDTTMKIPLKELLSVEEVEHFKALGLEDELEIEKEVPAKTYIDNAINALKSELLAEIAKSAPTEVKTEIEVETETIEEKSEEGEVETEIEVEPKADEEPTTDLDFNPLMEAMDQLKAAFAAEQK